MKQGDIVKGKESSVVIFSGTRLCEGDYGAVRKAFRSPEESGRRQQCRMSTRFSVSIYLETWM